MGETDEKRESHILMDNIFCRAYRVAQGLTKWTDQVCGANIPWDMATAQPDSKYDTKLLPW